MKEPPESETGCYGCWGRSYDMTNLKKGNYWFRSAFFFPKTGFTPDQVQYYLNIEDAPLQVKIKPCTHRKGDNISNEM